MMICIKAVTNGNLLISLRRDDRWCDLITALQLSSHISRDEDEEGDTLAN